MATADRTSSVSHKLSACTSGILSNPRGFALFLDVDGTLLDLAATPKGVRVPEGLIGVLQRLSLSFDGAIAVVTGRQLSEIDLLLSPLKLTASGVHGAEMRSGPERDIERVTAVLPPDVVQAMRKLSLAIPGVIAEPKGPGLAIHYRLAPDAGPEILAALEASLEAHRGTLEILPGKRLFEVIPAGLSKGTALASISKLQSFQGRVPVMIGDDIGDEAAFAVAEGLNGFGLRVAGERYGDDEADFAGPGSVVNWLNQLCHFLHRDHGMRAQH